MFLKNDLFLLVDNANNNGSGKNTSNRNSSGILTKKEKESSKRNFYNSQAKINTKEEIGPFSNDHEKKMITALTKDVSFKKILSFKMDTSHHKPGSYKIDSLEFIPNSIESARQNGSRVSTLILPESSKLKALIQDKEDLSPEMPDVETQLTELDQDLKIKFKRSSKILRLFFSYGNPFLDTPLKLTGTCNEMPLGTPQFPEFNNKLAFFQENMIISPQQKTGKLKKPIAVIEEKEEKDSTKHSKESKKTEGKKSDKKSKKNKSKKKKSKKNEDHFNLRMSLNQKNFKNEENNAPLGSKDEIMNQSDLLKKKLIHKKENVQN